MKVLITHQFNNAMRRLTPVQQQEVSKLYSLVASLEKDEVLSSPLLTRLISKNESIYTLRGPSVRVFCTFDAEGSVLFLDVALAGIPHATRSNNQKNETTLFGVKGEPVVYIAWNDDNTIYSFQGVPLAYIDDKNNIYGFNGKHLGWFENGVVRDHQGARVGFTREASTVYAQFEPFKGFKQFKPFKSFKQFAPFEPFKSQANSTIGLLEFLEDGR